MPFSYNNKYIHTSKLTILIIFLINSEQDGATSSWSSESDTTEEVALEILPKLIVSSMSTVHSKSLRTEQGSGLTVSATANKH